MLGTRRIVLERIVTSFAAVFTLLIVFMTFAAGPAQADPAAVKQAATETAALRDQVEELNAQVEFAVESYNKVADDLAKTDRAMQANRKRLAAAQRDLGVAQARLSARVNGIYRRGSPPIVELLVGAGSFSDLINRLEALVRIGAADNRVVREVEIYRYGVADRERKLEADHRHQQELAAQAEGARAEVETKLADRARALKGKEAELARLEAEEAVRLAEIKRAAEEALRLAEARSKARAVAANYSGARRVI